MTSERISTPASGSVLIVEDEPLIALDLERVVLEAGFRVVAIARSATEALAAAKRTPPDLVLSDIHLADGSSGLDAAREIKNISKAVIVFITAYPERLLTSERPHSTMLISKPFSSAHVRKTIMQALIPHSQSE